MFPDRTGRKSSSLPCVRTPLARSDVGQVTICGCGDLDLHIGPVTVRLSKDAFARVAALIDEAHAELQFTEQPPASTKAH